MVARKVVLGLVAVLLACGCGGGSSKGGAFTAPGSSAPGRDGGAVSAQDTADRIGCRSYVPDDTPLELFVAESGSCTFQDVIVTVYRFSTNEARDGWIEAATPYGIGRFVVFDRGVIVSDDQTVADRVSPMLGGEIRT